MPLARLMEWVRSKTGLGATSGAHDAPDERPQTELMANAEKALAMKRETGATANIPPHQTAHEGMRPANDPQMSDAELGRDAGFTPQMKRSGVARSGDAS